MRQTIVKRWISLREPTQYLEMELGRHRYIGVIKKFVTEFTDHIEHDRDKVILNHVRRLDENENEDDKNIERQEFRMTNGRQLRDLRVRPGDEIEFSAHEYELKKCKRKNSARKGREIVRELRNPRSILKSNGKV